jgi:hypothetical protein
MRKKQSIKYCEWCGKKTKNSPKLYFETPIMEWIEEKINDFDRMEILEFPSSPSNEEESEDNSPFSIELNVYNYLLNTQKDKIICDECFSHDSVLWNKYYDEIDIDSNKNDGLGGYFMFY